MSDTRSCNCGGEYPCAYCSPEIAIADTRTEGEVRMTAENHLHVLEAARIAFKREHGGHIETPSLDEVHALVSSLVSGKRDTFDTETHVAVPIAEIEDVQREASLVEESPYAMEQQCGEKILEITSRWLSTPDTESQR